MDAIGRRVAREAKRMTRKEVVVRAIAKELTWIQAAEICGITARQMRRLKKRYERHGYDGLVDGRGGKTRRQRIPVATIERLCQLRREQYAEFSVQHFWEKATEEHHLEISYTWAKLALQAAGLAEKSPGRGKYRRRRERRPLRGMMLHLDGSTHPWLAEQPLQDLIVVQDDADSRILYAQFVPQEGTLSTFAALTHVLRTAGRFGELYTDRGSHFCYTPVAGAAATTAHQGQVSRALKALGIRQILAYSPQARGRSERTFQTIQGRLPQELRAAGITTYAAANTYLTQTFLPDFNRRFTVTPAEDGTAFVPMIGIDLERLFSVQHERSVYNDSTVSFESLRLQLPRDDQRAHYVRCPVLVHEFPEGTLGISYQGRLLARYARDGQLLPALALRSAAERKAQQTGTARALSALPIVAPGGSLRVASTAGNRRAQPAGTLAPRVTVRPTPSAPLAGAGHSSTRAGAAAHNVDGDTRNPHPPATKQRPSSRAVHNVDSSLCHHPAPELRARRAMNKKPKDPKKNPRTERTS
jgi:helix-turn-helix protein